MTMGDRIKERRKAMGFTQEEFGKKLGVQKSAVAKWENGRVENLKRTTILRMSNILDCDPSYLMGYEDEEDQKIRELLSRMSYEEKLELLNYMEYLIAKRK